MKVEYNKYRVTYLLSLFKMTKEELLCLINKGLKKEISWEEIYSDEIELNHLKRIDKVFNKGLYYYYDPSVPTKDACHSVFFRKEKFTSDLNLGARQRVREFEDKEIQISALSKLSGLKLTRMLSTYSIYDDPKETAFAIRDEILPAYVIDKRAFLKAFINNLGKYNIMVFEFVDTANKKLKANIDGFFIKPNTIVLKRSQHSLSREIFTLAHEFGHYLLGAEDIDEIKETVNSNQSKTEKWCNTFAFNMLLGKENAYTLDNVDRYDARIDYGFDIVETIADRTHLSKLSIFTSLFLQKKIAYEDYNNIRDELLQKEQAWLASKRLRMERDKGLGIVKQMRNPKPITADIVYTVYNCALNAGVISEYEYCSALNVKPSEINNIFYGGYH